MQAIRSGRSFQKVFAHRAMRLQRVTVARFSSETGIHGPSCDCCGLPTNSCFVIDPANPFSAGPLMGTKPRATFDDWKQWTATGNTVTGVRPFSTTALGSEDDDEDFRETPKTDSTLDAKPLNGNQLIQRMLESNVKWAQKTAAEDPEFFPKLSQRQQPKFLYIGCSDSRVPANRVLGMGFGELFVHRNVGNLVPGNDLNVLSVIEYAVGHLNVTDIIVNGHYDCGAIRAATQRQDLGTLENWLRQIRDVYRLHKDYLDLLENEEEHHRSLVELNVIEQCLNIYKTGVVQRKRMDTRRELLKKRETDPSVNVKEEMYPRIHGMVFNPANGLLKKLTVDFRRRVGSLDHIYGLYDVKSSAPAKR